MNDERIEEFLKGVALPEYTSDQHKQQLRRQILRRLETKRAARGTARRWKIAALVFGVVCTGVAATQLIRQAQRYHFVGKTADGRYYFTTEPEKVEVTYRDANGNTNRFTVTVGQGADLHADSTGGVLDSARIEQHRKDLEEIALLRQKNARELMIVCENEVNGISLGRTFIFKYVLADGSTRTNGEGGMFHLRAEGRVSWHGSRRKSPSCEPGGRGSLWG